MCRCFLVLLCIPIKVGRIKPLNKQAFVIWQTTVRVTWTSQVGRLERKITKTNLISLLTASLNSLNGAFRLRTMAKIKKKLPSHFKNYFQDQSWTKMLSQTQVTSHKFCWGIGWGKHNSTQNTNPCSPICLAFLFIPHQVLFVPWSLALYIMAMPQTTSHLCSFINVIVCWQTRSDIRF